MASAEKNKYRQYTGIMYYFTRILTNSMMLFALLYLSGFLEHMGLYMFPYRYMCLLLVGLIAVTFLFVPASQGAPRNRLPWYDALLILGGIVLPIYLFIVYDEKVEVLGLATTEELIMGTMMLVAILEGTRRVAGWSIPLLILAFMSHAVFANHFPGFLYGRGFSVARVLGFLSQSDSGVFGVGLHAASFILVAFLTFGVFIEASGAGTFFINLANALVGHVRGGPAKVAVIASGLFGMISGSAGANVATTGVLTIPMMKKIGYKAEFAGAVESVASTGGQIMPPVMGVVIFIMVEILEVSYLSICTAALVPAFLYFMATFIQVDLEAARIGLEGISRAERPSVVQTLKDGWRYIVPIGVLVYFLTVLHYRPQTCAIYAVIALLLINTFKKKWRMGLKAISAVLEKGGISMIMAGMTCACVGMLIGSVDLTGLGINMSSTLLHLSGNSLILLLVYTAIASLILGMGLPAIPCYVILAVLVAPALVTFGLVPLQAHLFVFYFGLASFITPPVCIACYIAAGIAGGKPLTTGLYACRLGIVAYLVPFMFAFNTALLLMGNPMNIVLAVVTAIIGVGALAVAAEGYLRGRVSWIQRGLLAAGGILLMKPGLLTDVVGIALCAIAALWHAKTIGVKFLLGRSDVASKGGS